MLTSRGGALLVTGALVLGILIGGFAGVYAAQARPDLIPLIAQHSTRGSLDQATLAQALRIIQSDYYGSNLDYSTLSDSTLQGLVAGLNDPYSAYLTPDEYRRTQASESGQYSGIGIYVDFRGQYPLVTGLIPGAPAGKAGIRPGDVIVAVDGKPLKGVTAAKASSLIQGPVGSKVHLELQRGASSYTVDVLRERINAPFVLSSKLPGRILYVRIFSFGDGTADQLASALRDGLPGSAGLVLDLRANPGGFIDSARVVISDFVPHGEAFELHDRAGHVERDDVSGDHPAAGHPTVVLVDGSTASAAEIVAGSLRVNLHIKLVGQTTFGKGSVQEDFPLSNGGDLHLTIKHWFLPDGSSVQGHGLTPDDRVALAAPDNEYDVTDQALGYAKDTQLLEALKLLEAGT